MSLITYEALQGLQDKVLIACEVCLYYLKGSFLLTVPYSVSELKEKIRKINLHQHLPIILYDKGSMYSASRVYVFLSAVGFTDVHVLYGGLMTIPSDSCHLTTEPPDPVPLTERILLSYKNNYLLTKEEYIQMNTSSIDTLYANFLYKHIYDFYTILNEENIQAFTLSCGISLQKVKDNVVYGEISCLLAVFLHYLGFKDFYVLVDNFDTAVFELSNKTDTETVYLSVGNASEKSYTSVELEHYVANSNKKGGKEKSGISNNACGKCSVI